MSCKPFFLVTELNLGFSKKVIPSLPLKKRGSSLPSHKKRREPPLTLQKVGGACLRRERIVFLVLCAQQVTHATRLPLLATVTSSATPLGSDAPLHWSASPSNLSFRVLFHLPFFSLNPHHWTWNQRAWLTASLWSKMAPKTLADYRRHRDQEMNAPDWLIYTTRNERSLLIRSFSGRDCTFTLSRRRKLPRWLAKSACISAFAQEPAPH